MSFLCGPRKPGADDLTAVREFGEWLATHPHRPRPHVHPVRRPQHCNCGANQLIAVAHLDTCLSRRPAPR
ncbi:hypothetical protein [Kribbella sp. NPDC023855]|uniref:hypothetical protein n=1 Tax=Kribbella sp. NPDC023855 TaxID=3154698 RepID=UPI0033DEABDA